MPTAYSVAENVAATHLTNEDSAKVFALLAVADSIESLANAVHELAECQVGSQDIAHSIHEAGDAIARGLGEIGSEIRSHG